MASKTRPGQSTARSRAEINARSRAFREAAARLIADRSWNSFAMIGEESSVLRDEHHEAMDVVIAIARIFERESPTSAECALLKRLHKEITPLALRTEDGRHALALREIAVAVNDVQATTKIALKRKTARLLLRNLDVLEFGIGDHWRQHLDTCIEMLEEVNLRGGPYQSMPSGVLVRLLHGAGKMRSVSKKRLLDQISAAGRRGRKAVDALDS